jgi:hypothetical protein
VTLALLLDAAAAQGDAALLMGVWKYFGRDARQQQYHPQPGTTTASSGSSGGSSGSSMQLPPPVVLHALTYAAVKCDLAAARKSEMQHSSLGLQGVASVIFHPESCTVDVLHEVQRMVQRQQDATGSVGQQQQDPPRHQQQLVLQRPASGPAPQLPLPLLHPKQASDILQQCVSAADADLLLLSQLCQPGGLRAEQLVSLQQKLQVTLASTVQQGGDYQALVGDSRGSSRHSGQQPEDSFLLQLLGELPAINNNPRPAVFPPLLRADVARAAVAAYLRTGAFGRATAVAQQAAVASPGDIQPLHLMIRGAARVGAALPGLVMVGKLRDKFWQLPSQKAQAALLR